jgi:5-oxoprolinase (ATP-hydrolysing) subunit B
VTIHPASDRSLLLTFGPEAGVTIRHLTEVLQRVRAILNLHPAYTSLLIDFDPRFHTHEGVESLVREAMEKAAGEAEPASRLVKVPVHYGGEGGPDLEDVARHTGLSAREVVDRFAATEYAVAFVGFSTCFPYLTGLPAELATPRLPAPRKHVPAGSVAIGGAQAGVYPLSSPGGWRLIGRTALRLFDPEGEPPALLRMGDRVRFIPL